MLGILFLTELPSPPLLPSSFFALNPALKESSVLFQSKLGSHALTPSHPLPQQVYGEFVAGQPGPDPIYAPGGGWTSTAPNNSTAVTEQPFFFPSRTHRGLSLCPGHLLFFFPFSERAGGPNTACLQAPLFPLACPSPSSKLVT